MGGEGVAESVVLDESEVRQAVQEGFEGESLLGCEIEADGRKPQVGGGRGTGTLLLIPFKPNTPTRMNALRNRVLLIGRLGQDPERIEFDGDKVKANLRLATNEVYRNAQGEKTETTQWHNVIAWGQLAAIMTQYLSKGSEVAIEGRLVYRQYEDKTGQQRVAAEIVTQEMLMLDRVPQDA